MGLRSVRRRVRFARLGQRINRRTKTIAIYNFRELVGEHVSHETQCWRRVLQTEVLCHAVEEPATRVLAPLRSVKWRTILNGHQSHLTGISAPTLDLEAAVKSLNLTLELVYQSERRP